RLAQGRLIRRRHDWIARADGEGRFDHADIPDGGRRDQPLLGEYADQRLRQDNHVGGPAGTQVVRHGSYRAELSGDVEAGLGLERRRNTGDEALGCTAAEDIQAAHAPSSMAAISASRVIGNRHTRTPSASNTALAIAAVTGPCAASPAPTGSLSLRWTNSTSTSGTSLKRSTG